MERATCFWFYSLIFRIYCSSMHVRTDNDHYDRWSSVCIRISFRGLSFHFAFISYFLVCEQKDELDVSFSGHCARRQKRPGKLPRRELQQMTSHPLDHLNDSRAWELILVTTLSLCSFSICSWIFFLLHHHRLLFWTNSEFSC